MLSIIIPTFNEEKNIGKLIKEVKKIVKSLNQRYEIIVVDARSKDNTYFIAKKQGVRVFFQEKPGLAQAMLEAIEKTRGEWLLTMDADFSHQPKYIKTLWENRRNTDIVIASRWVKGGGTNQSFFREFLSRIFNSVYNLFLNLNIKDLNSNFRLYKKEVFRNIILNKKDFAGIAEIIVKAKFHGYKIKEIPFFYYSRKEGKSHLKIFQFGISYIGNLFGFWKMKISKVFK